jgi:hypothetical protein
MIPRHRGIFFFVALISFDENAKVQQLTHNSDFQTKINRLFFVSCIRQMKTFLHLLQQPKTGLCA